MRETIETFLSGYLQARANGGSAVSFTPETATVRYQRPMGRSAEVFAWGDAAPPEIPADAWVTVIGDSQATEPVRPRWLPEPFQHRTAEFLMQAGLPLTGQTPSVGATIRRLRTSDDIEQFNDKPHFASVPLEHAESDGAALFVAEIGGAVAASGRYGVASAETVVVDRMSTLPEFRRRGLATALLYAMADVAAGQGHSRMLLISSRAGRKVYKAVGFVVLARVDVYAPPVAGS